MTTSIDLIIIGIFLLITLSVGLYYGRRISSFQEYAVGNRTMSNMVIILSLIATTYDGQILNSRPESYYRLGFYALMMDLASPINFYLASKFIIVRMKEFVGHLSVAESMGSIYGPMVRIFTGIFGMIMSIALLTSQIKVSLLVTTILCPEIEHFIIHPAIILTLLVIFYSTFGGVRSVALTDVYQFFFLAFVFPS